MITAPSFASGASITLSATGRTGTRLLTAAVASSVKDPNPSSNITFTTITTRSR